MKIRLISPSRNFYNLENIDTYGNKRRKTLFPPLNLALLASLTPSEYEVELVDESVLLKEVKADVDLVGITSMTGTASRMYQLADQYRELGVKVVLGGSHVTALPEEALLHADSVVAGEVDEIWSNILKDFQNGNQKSIYRQDNFSNLNGLHTLNRNLLPQGGYYMPRSIQTSRGCPYNCSFCTVTSTFGSRYRYRPIEEVVEEIKETPGPSFVALTDDNILGHKKRAKELFRALKELKIMWGSQCSINNAEDTELLRLAYESGCRGLFIGIESVCEDTLKEMGKERVNRPERYYRLIENFHNNGIRLLGAFVFGFDTDDLTTFEKNVKFAINSKIELAQFAVLTPYPGTAVREKLIKEGRLLNDNWENYYGGWPVFQPERMTPEQLLHGTQWAWKKFYGFNSKMKRLLRYGRYTPIYWLANNVFGHINLSNTSRAIDVIKRMWQFVDRNFNINDK